MYRGVLGLVGRLLHFFPNSKSSLFQVLLPGTLEILFVLLFVCWHIRTYRNACMHDNLSNPYFFFFSFSYPFSLSSLPTPSTIVTVSGRHYIYNTRIYCTIDLAICLWLWMMEMSMYVTGIFWCMRLGRCWGQTICMAPRYGGTFPPPYHVPHKFPSSTACSILYGTQMLESSSLAHLHINIQLVSYWVLMHCYQFWMMLKGTTLGPIGSRPMLSNAAWIIDSPPLPTNPLLIINAYVRRGFTIEYTILSTFLQVGRWGCHTPSE